MYIHLMEHPKPNKKCVWGNSTYADMKGLHSGLMGNVRHRP